MTLPTNDDTVRSVVGLRNIPEDIRSLDTFADPDYVDLFTITTSTATATSAEEWARVALEHTSSGRAAPRLWRLLGLRLGPTNSADHVQGWKVADRGADWIRIESTSWCMTAHAIFRVGDGQVSLALFVRYDRPVAAIIWTPVSIMHRRAVPVLLRQASRRARL